MSLNVPFSRIAVAEPEDEEGIGELSPAEDEDEVEDLTREFISQTFIIPDLKPSKNTAGLPNICQSKRTHEQFEKDFNCIVPALKGTKSYI